MATSKPTTPQSVLRTVRTDMIISELMKKDRAAQSLVREYLLVKEQYDALVLSILARELGKTLYAYLSRAIDDLLWWTSNKHFQHLYKLAFKGRQFASLEDMKKWIALSKMEGDNAEFITYSATLLDVFFVTWVIESEKGRGAALAVQVYCYLQAFLESSADHILDVMNAPEVSHYICENIQGKLVEMKEDLKYVADHEISLLTVDLHKEDPTADIGYKLRLTDFWGALHELCVEKKGKGQQLQ